MVSKKKSPGGVRSTPGASTKEGITSMAHNDSTTSTAAPEPVFRHSLKSQTCDACGAHIAGGSYRVYFVGTGKTVCLACALGPQTSPAVLVMVLA